MFIETQKYDVGVIVGRFQVPELHEGHRELIEFVRAAHEKVVIFLGVSPLWSTAANPLDFESRKQMLLDEFPDLNVLYVKDVHDDALWSRRLDRQVADLVTPAQSVVLYGSRDSFLPHYQGKLPTRPLEPTRVLSGTAARKLVARSSTRGSLDFRAGAIWAASARFPTAFTTVDVAILDETGQKLLLGRKPDETEFRFIGGFSDPRSASFEDDVRREVAEEAGIEVGDIQYIGSRVQDDWRYRGEQDCIKTLFWTAKHIFGRPTPGDDIEEVRWFDIHMVGKSPLVDTHKPLGEMLITHLTKKNGGK